MARSWSETTVLNRTDLAGILRNFGPLVLMFVMLPLFGLGLFFLGVAGFDYWAFREMSERGTGATAQVHSLQETAGGYIGDLSWIDQGGERRSAQRVLSQKFVLENKQRISAEGVHIRYLVDHNSARPLVVGDEDMEHSIIREEPKFALVLMLTGIACSILALFGLTVLAQLWKIVEVRRVAGQSRQRAADVRNLVQHLALETVTVSGYDAFATWERLRAERHGYPVVLGNDQEMANLFETHVMEKPIGMAAVAEANEKAQALRHPADLYAKQKADAEQAHEAIMKLAAENPRFEVPKMIFVDAQGRETRQPDEETRAKLLQESREDDEPSLGEWPERVEDAPGLSVIGEIVGSESNSQRSYNFQIKKHVNVALFPVSHSYEVLGYLRYGNWNACPPAEYHIAALRSWSERYGAEIVGIANDTLNIRVTRKPETREEAIELAREHYIYCNDVIDQGVGTLSNLAAQLMQHEWWYFWWD